MDTNNPSLPRIPRQSPANERFSLDEVCLLVILSEKPVLTTKEILDEIMNHQDYCHSCVSGTTVMVAGKKLIRKGYVKKTPVHGGFQWELIKTPPLIEELVKARKKRP